MYRVIYKSRVIDHTVKRVCITHFRETYIKAVDIYHPDEVMTERWSVSVARERKGEREHKR